ncbi:MAG TPA: saccharopine dehydrogenase NADP-binding domain-containing protein [Solirubrobacteraceae bacterium]|nr:saccharopine dehydrogenase NADP-binding domain-containing protein [Solirubrobacteraceae bacterium]
MTGVAVLGAGGIIARAIVRDLADSPEVDRLLLLDIDGERAAQVAAEHGGGRARAVGVDARNGFATALAGCGVLVNAASYRVNLVAMEAALAAGCDYLDLGGLYWMTARQLELHDRFAAAGRLAVLGMGSSPGKTNVMAVYGARILGLRHGLGAGHGGVRELGGEPVREINVAAAGRDPEPTDLLRTPYALQTLVDELSMNPVVLDGGKPRELAPMAPGGLVRFPEPIGEVMTIHTLHSELQTFGTSFGVQRASFRLALAPELLRRLEALRDAAAREVAAAQAAAAPPSARAVSAHVVEVLAAGGRRVRVSALTQPMEDWGMGGGIVSTAAPAAALVRLLARGRIAATGVHPPETCVDPDDLFPELERRGCRFEVTA